MNARYLERARQLALAARRRSDLERWRENYCRILATPVRSDEEQLAKHQALELMELAEPG